MSTAEGEVEDVVPPMMAHAVPRDRPRAKAFSDISAMVSGNAPGYDVPYNSRMLPYDASGLDALPAKEQEMIRDAILNATGKSGRTKTKSEIANMMAQSFMDQQGGNKRAGGRSRQKSNADTIVKFGYAPQLGYDDLK
jgi:hypothetical protein